MTCSPLEVSERVDSGGVVRVCSAGVVPSNVSRRRASLSDNLASVVLQDLVVAEHPGAIVESSETVDSQLLG
jgi:hypothetical protein